MSKHILSLILLSFLFTISVYGQKKVMDQSAYHFWNKIESRAITPNGQYVKYHLAPGRGDKTLVLYNAMNQSEQKFERAEKSAFSSDGNFLVYQVSAPMDSVLMMRRNKVKKDDLPKDSLVVISLENMDKSVFPAVQNYKLPTHWTGQIAFSAEVNSSDTTSTKKKKAEEHFFIYDLEAKTLDTLKKVDKYYFAKYGNALVFSRDGEDSSSMAGVYYRNFKGLENQEVHKAEGKYSQLSISEDGEIVAFIADLDTTERRMRSYELFTWRNGQKMSQVSVRKDSRFTADQWKLSKNSAPSFSRDSKRLFFGVAPDPVMEDSLALDEEMVQVEVWTTQDPLLYTMQELRERQLKNKTYEVMLDLSDGSLQEICNADFPNSRKSVHGNGKYALVYTDLPYLKSTTWLGRTYNDVKIMDLETGNEWELGKKMNTVPRFSPGGDHLIWFDLEKSHWYIYNIGQQKTTNLTESIQISFADEENDRPALARSYGVAGWAENDAALFLYDRYDVWKFNLENDFEASNLTNGRNAKWVHRVIRLDPEADFLERNNLIHLFNEETKQSGYAKLDNEAGNIKLIEKGDVQYSRGVTKAKDSEDILYTKETFEQFPDLILGTLEFEKSKTISNANPQQKDYRWGTIELFEWEDFKGISRQGLLVKPEGFDPNKKYPVIVNFYERSSDGLHRHRAPEPHRSTINYSYYANKGYIIFNPDVYYEIGYPGKSCYDAVVSGVEALSENEFIDKERIGVQGHSWGGYQIAHLLNKTNIFKCAESGAPVVNMVSAYGGIRWGSGMSRMFQYEKTQSRLGATLWERPDLYLENSPIFELDKIQTPVLILHNDNDGAVPWYQGIEYYMALRRLNKPAWFLNYNGEPHWPLKWHNRLDFNKRMEQFFAHYLLDEPMPKWMKEGVDVLNKGINQGFELEDEKE